MKNNLYGTTPEILIVFILNIIGSFFLGIFNIRFFSAFFVILVAEILLYLIVISNRLKTIHEDFKALHKDMFHMPPQ